MDKLKTKILLISLMLIFLLSLQGAAAASNDVNLTSENIDLSICDNEGDLDSDSILTADNGEDPPDEGKDNSTITITDYTSPINIGDDTTVGFRINRDVMDNAVTLWINGSEILTYDFEFNEGSFLITKDKFPSEGTYNISVQYLGNSMYNPSNNASCIIAVNKNNITIDPIATGDFVVGGRVDVTFTLPTYIDGNLIVTIDDEAVVGYAIDNGTVTIPGSYDLGNHTVTVNLTGDTHYNDATGSTTFYIDKANSTITITDCPTPINMGEDTYVAFRINRDVMDNAVDLWINGSYILTYDFEFNEDSFLITKDKFPSEGNYNITVHYRGNSRYNASNNASCMITVNKNNVTMNAEGSTVRYGENATITVTGLPDDATGNVSVRIGDGIFFANIANGKAVIKIPGLAVHEYEGLIVEYSGDNKYNNAFAEATVIVKPSSLKTVIEIPFEDISGKAGEKIDISIKITDENSNPVENGTATLTIDGKTYTAEVKNGIATFKNVELPEKDTVADVYYQGNEYYNSSSATFSIKISKDDNNNTDENQTQKHASSKAVDTTVTGNPIAILAMTLAILVITYRKRK